MITRIIRINPRDMALSPTRGRRTKARSAARRKAYSPIWFQRRNPDRPKRDGFGEPSHFGLPFEPGLFGAPVSVFRITLFRVQLQRRRVDAIAQSGGSRAVIED